MRRHLIAKLLVIASMVVGLAMAGLPVAAQDSLPLSVVPGGGSVTRVAIGPNQDVVAFLGRCSGCNVEDLYTVPLAGGQPVRLNVLNTGETVYVDRFSFTRDGTQLLFAGPIAALGPVDHALFRVPVDGSAPPTRLSPVTNSITEVAFWGQSPDGQTVVYVLLDGNNSTRGVHSVPLAGDLNNDVALSTGGRLLGMSGTDAFISSNVVDRVPLSGPAAAAVQLTPEDQLVYSAELSPDGRTIVYSSVPDIYSDEEALYSVPVQGGAPTVLFAAPSDDTSLDRFAVAPNSDRVLVKTRGGSDVNDPDALLSVPIGGPASAATQLNGEATGTRSLEVAFALFTPDGQHVIFEGYNDYDAAASLVRAPVAGPASAASTIVTTPVDEALGSIALSPDGQHLAWIQTNDSYEPLSVHAAPTDGSGPVVELSRPPAGGSMIPSDFGGISVDFAGNDTVLFTGVQDNAQSLELHRVPVDGPASAGQPVNGPLSGGGDVFGYDSTDDGSAIVFIAAPDGGQRDLFISGDPGAAPPPQPPVDSPVERWAGSDRHATAAAVSSNTFQPGVPVAFIAVDNNFPDALAGVAAAGAVGGPILLTSTSALPGVTADELARLQPGRIVILGGTGAVSDAVAAELAAHTAGTVTRLAGPGRYETAAAVSAATFGPGVPVAYVATGTNFPDALAGGPAAGLEGGPILLTGSDVLPDATASELTRLAPQRIVILGGSGVVTDAVADALASHTSGTVSRLAGSGRHETAAVVSAATFEPGVPIVLIAVGSNFPDALAGGPAAVSLGGPILLVERDVIPQSTIAELQRLQPARIVVLGGGGVISADVASGLAAYLG